MGLKVSELKVNKAYCLTKNSKEWRTFLKGHKAINNWNANSDGVLELNADIRYIRLSPLSGEYGVQYLDVDFGCGWMILNSEGKDIGYYSRGIDYNPSLTCTDYPILTHEELISSTVEYVAYNPQKVSNLPVGMFLDNKDLTKQIVKRFNEVTQEMVSSLSAAKAQSLLNKRAKELEQLKLDLKSVKSQTKNRIKATEKENSLNVN